MLSVKVSLLSIKMFRCQLLLRSLKQALWLLQCQRVTHIIGLQNVLLLVFPFFLTFLLFSLSVFLSFSLLSFFLLSFFFHSLFFNYLLLRYDLHNKKHNKLHCSVLLHVHSLLFSADTTVILANQAKESIQVLLYFFFFTSYR